MVKEYIIKGTGNKFQDGIQVKNVIEKDFPYLDNTFEFLRPLEQVFGGELEQVSYEMVVSYGFRMLKEKSIYNNSIFLNKSFKRIRYFSRIKTSFLVTPGLLKCFFSGVDESFSCLHMIEKDAVLFTTQLKYGSSHYIVYKNEYEAMIKEAIVAARINPDIYG